MKKEWSEFLPITKLRQKRGAIVENERAFEERSRTVIEIPVGLMPAVRKMVAQQERSSL